MMLAILVTAVSLISSLMMMNYSRQVQAGSKRPRVKSMMTSIESKVRQALLSPSSYSGCATGFGGGGRTTCTLNEGQITSLRAILPDAPCPNGPNTCGIAVIRESFNPSLNTPNGIVTRAVFRIRYEGTDFPLKDILVTEDVPADILQTGGRYRCPDTAPKFNGFLANGQIDCTALPPRAGVNEFVNTIDMNNLNTTKFPLPSLAQCPGNDINQFVNYVNWGNGGTLFSITCTSRLDPFSTLGFTPSTVAPGDLVYTPNTD